MNVRRWPLTSVTRRRRRRAGTGPVDRVRPEVAERPAAGHLLVVAPGPRGLGVDQPVLEVLAAEVVNLPEDAVVDEPLRVLDGRDEPIVERRACGHISVSSGLGHFLSRIERGRKRSLAERGVPASSAAMDGSAWTWFGPRL